MSQALRTFLENFRKDGMMIAAGIVTLLLLCFVTYTAVYVELKNKEVVLTLFGGIYTLAGSIVGYYYGTSKGSADKTRILAEKIDKETT